MSNMTHELLPPDGGVLNGGVRGAYGIGVQYAHTMLGGHDDAATGD